MKKPPKSPRAWNSTLPAGSSLPRGPGPKRKSRTKPKKRTADEYARIYGSEARVEWFKAQPCIGCGIVGYSENAHTQNDGKGRKGHHSTIVPACGVHPDRDGNLVEGCHAEMDHGKRAFEAKYRLSLNTEAAEWHRRWYLHEHGQPFHEAPRQSDAHD